MSELAGERAEHGFDVRKIVVFAGSGGCEGIFSFALGCERVEHSEVVERAERVGVREDMDVHRTDAGAIHRGIIAVSVGQGVQQEIDVALGAVGAVCGGGIHEKWHGIEPVLHHAEGEWCHALGLVAFDPCFVR